MDPDLERQIDKSYDSNGLSNYDDGDEELWCCDGADEEIGLLGGCRSNQTGFGRHEGVLGYQCPHKDTCNFDMCDLCIRWCLY